MLDVGLKTLPLAGLALSIYTVLIGMRLRRDASYRAWCDINAGMSCSKAVLSAYGVILDLPNGVYGTVFFSLIFIVSWAQAWALVFRLCVPALLVCFYLMYGLIRVVRTICVVCYLTYAVIGAELALSFVAMYRPG